MGTMDEELQLLRTRAEEAVRLQSELKKVIENTDRVEALYQQEQASVLNYPLSPVSALLFAASGECPLVIPLAGIVTCLDASDICTKLRGSVLTSSLTFTHQPADHYFFLSGVCGCVFTPRPMELFCFCFLFCRGCVCPFPQVLRKKYWNMMEDMKGKIRVYARCRPFAQ